MSPQRTGFLSDRTGSTAMADVLHAVEAALFLVIASGVEAPASCSSASATVVECGARGVVAMQPDGSVMLPGRLRVDRSRADAIRFSNGIEGWRGATGWISFSNGLSVRREQGRWRFSGGLSCMQVGSDRGTCR
ncbi:MAG: hypothetical protein FJX21_06775 [Alphaproteobacteria bacterium]|nr:hypothetical protein [Alphaproteobacteria bacterium]